jgi:thiol:disulfide interchange protein DsbD
MNRNAKLAAMIGSVPVAAALSVIWFNVRDNLQPPASHRAESTEAESAAYDEASSIQWRSDYVAALDEAKATGKTVVIDFYANWCVPCAMMEKTTFNDRRVRQRMTHLIALKVDVDQHYQIAQRYGVEGLPAIAVIAPDGQPLTGAIGYLDADRFLEVLDSASG